MTVERPKNADEASQIRLRLQEFDRKRLHLERRLRELERSTIEPAVVASPTALIANGSPAADKIALFRRLFAGRTDVFPVRWENSKTGRSGYAPACANEWVWGVCGKPQVKCGECPSQAFMLAIGPRRARLAILLRARGGGRSSPPRDSFC